MRFSERNKMPTGFVPKDVDAASGVTGDYVSLKEYDHITITVVAGTVGATCNITVNEATDVAGTDAQALTVNYGKNGDVTSGDTLTVQTAAASIATGTDNNQKWVIEIDAVELSDGFDCVNVNVSDPGTATIMGAEYILSKPRHAQYQPPSAIID